jgi:phosphoglycolate phosphatase
MKLALFDCDGTLVDGQANHCLAMEQAFREQGLDPLPHMETRRVIGLSLLESMRILVPDAGEDTHRKMVDDYKHAFYAMRAQGMIHEPLYDGIADLLRALDTDGWQLGVATGKSDRGLNSCLEHHGIKPLFVTLQTADRHPSKPHPSMVYQAMADAGVEAEATIMIGDTSFDMEMGRAAGCRNIGVTWGYHLALELRAYGADVIVNDVTELAAALKAMGEEMI